MKKLWGARRVDVAGTGRTTETIGAITRNRRCGNRSESTIWEGRSGRGRTRICDLHDVNVAL